jgi:hypothetical protein
MKATFLVEIEIPADEIARTEEPYYARLDIEGKVYEVFDLRLVEGDGQ